MKQSRDVKNKISQLIWQVKKSTGRYMKFNNITFSIPFYNFYTTLIWMSEIGLFRGFLYKHFIVQEKKNMNPV